MKSNQNIAKFLETIDQISLSGDNVPGLIISRPGFGKTSTVQLWCNYKGYNLFTLIPSRYSSDDVLGLQSVNNGELHRLTPSWYNKLVGMSKNGKRTVLFIDEITTCDPYVQGPLLDLIFSKSLGEEYYLPENTLIVAAGNYSSDLNNMYRLSSPMINRFQVLNLNNEDYNIYEILEDEFENLKTNEQIKDFLDLEKSSAQKYSFGKFKDWVKFSREISFGKPEVIEDDEVGILGFTSTRSLTNSLKFACTYMQNFSDELWMRVVGDTLGSSSKREGKYMRDVLFSFSEEFINDDKSDRTILEICNDILNGGNSTANFLELENTIKNTNWDDITEADYKGFIDMSKKFSNNRNVKFLVDLMKNKAMAQVD